jgi:hypothetical protein
MLAIAFLNESVTIDGSYIKNNWQLIQRQKTAINKQTSKLRGLSPRANYSDRATAACQRS